VTGGLDVVKAIERVKVEESRPVIPIKIVNIDITQ
jgi:hypothetical protein